MLIEVEGMLASWVVGSEILQLQSSPVQPFPARCVSYVIRGEVCPRHKKDRIPRNQDGYTKLTIVYRAIETKVTSGKQVHPIELICYGESY
jgi:hypothetical protein